MAVQFEPRDDCIGMFPRAVGENEFAAGQFFQRGAERRIGLDRRMVDLMHDLEIFVGLHIVLDHQPAHRRAVALVIILLDFERLVLRHAEKIRDVAADLVVDLPPQPDVMRIERVVEIEHPGFDMGETARGFLRRVSSIVMVAFYCRRARNTNRRLTPVNPF